MIPRIDAHQHFWSYSPRDYVWIDDSMAALKQSFLPPDLAPQLDQHNLDGSVAVQARQSVDETRWLLDLAGQYPRIRGVVGWLDLQSDSLPALLDSFSACPKLKGLRHVIQDEPDDQFMLSPTFIRGVSLLARYGLTYDILIFSRHLHVTQKFISHFSGQPFVIDHCAKPAIRNGEFDAWRRELAELARYENMYCKLSGLITEADWESWQPRDIIPYLESVIDIFGPDRVMFGSDWPVCTLAGSYADVIGLVETVIASLSPDEQSAIMGRTASRFYSLKT